LDAEDADFFTLFKNKTISAIDGRQREEYEKMHEKWVADNIAKELTPQGDLLPPWQKYPKYPNGSLAWRMGGGEAYLLAWDTWRSQMTREQLVEYFKKYAPLPIEWLSWVANCCGFNDAITEIISGTAEFAGIHWLEEQGLASFHDFKLWHDERMKNRLTRGSP